MPENENSESFKRRAEVAMAAWTVRRMYEDVAAAMGVKMSTARSMISTLRRIGMIDGYMPRIDKDNLFANAVHDPSGCILWTRGTYRGGYGSIRHNGMTYGAHKLSWELANDAKVPDGMYVCHSCDTPACINPAHLFLGTQKQNVLDMMAKGRRVWGVGRKVHTAKLTDEDIPLIRAARKNGEKISDIARRYGVGTTAISDVVLLKRWKHIA